jgi:signal transduction histidine kinase
MASFNSDDGQEIHKVLKLEVTESNAKSLEAYNRAQSAFEKAHDLFSKNQKMEERGIDRIYEEAIQATKLIMWEYDMVRHHITTFDDPSTRSELAKFNLPTSWDNVPESITHLFELEDVPKLLAMYQDVDAGKNSSCEVWYKNVLGKEPRCVRIIYRVVCDKTGKPLKAYGIGQNITAEKKVEERYKREIDFLKNHLEDNLLARGQFNLTQNYVVNFVDVSGKGLKGITVGQNLDKLIQDFTQNVYPQDNVKPNALEILNREYLINAYKKGVMQHRTRYVLCQSGKFPLWVVMQINVYMNPDTGYLECFFYAYDNTDYRLKECIIQQLYALHYEDLGYLYVKERLYMVHRIDGSKVFSGDYDEIMDKYFFHRVVSEELPSLRSKLSLTNIVKTLKDNDIYSFTVSMLDENGKVNNKLIQLFYLNEILGIIFFCLVDITEETAEKEKQLLMYKAAKLEADKANQFKSNFLSSMSHDLRTPLNGVLGFTDLALKADNMMQKQEYLQKIQISGQLLLDLVNDTLDLSRIESGKLELNDEPVDGKQFWESIVLPLIPTTTINNIKLYTNISSYPNETLLLDKIKVKKILLNLISNAIKYTLSGGTVKVNIFSLKNEDGVSISRLVVEDNGIGMSEEFLKKLYEPFSQERRAEAANIAGTGLGMSIVKRYVDFMHGSIRVESQKNLGTKFTVDLPIKHCEIKNSELLAKQEADATAYEQAILIGRKVLLCEDNQLNAEIASHLLKNKNITVDWVKDGREALTKFKDSVSGYYDFILMDIRMPNMDGYTATRAIRKLNRSDAASVPIIAMTGDAFEEDIRHTNEVGMNGFVAKPVIPNSFYHTIIKVLSSAQA